MLKKDEKGAEKLDINDLVFTTLKLCRSDLLLRNIAVVQEFEGDIPPVDGDRVQLAQVILNLITIAEAIDNRLHVSGPVC